MEKININNILKKNDDGRYKKLKKIDCEVWLKCIERSEACAINIGLDAVGGYEIEKNMVGLALDILEKYKKSSCTCLRCKNYRINYGY